MNQHGARNSAEASAGEPRRSPLVSVGMPVFNGERYLALAIESILTQSFRDFELVIADNASTDRSAAIVREYMRSDDRIRYYRQSTNVGAPRNFNSVLDQSVGTYFKWASANDLCDPDLLQACLDVLERRPEVVVCFAKTRFIDEMGAVIQDFEDNVATSAARPSDRFRHILDHMGKNSVYPGLFRTSVLRRTRPEAVYEGGDLVRVAELSLHGGFHELPEYLFYRRMTSDTATSCRGVEAVREVRAPGVKSRFHWSEWKRAIGYFGAAIRSPITWGEKVRIAAYLARRCYWCRRSLWDELRSNLSPMGSPLQDRKV